MNVDLHILPMQWAMLLDLSDTPYLDSGDLACLAEVREVLARHGKLKRFALHLAHRHFDLEPGEVLIERPDEANRTQHISPGRLDGVANARPTTWLFDDRPAMRLTNNVYCACVINPLKTACMYHGKSSAPGPGQLKEEEARRKGVAEEKATFDRGMGKAGGHDFNKEWREDVGLDDADRDR